MSLLALGLSSFFSLHRPISITQTMPRTVSEEHFASIFAARSKASRISETMSTLSDTIDQLEGPMAQMTIGGQEEQMQNGMQRLEVRNPDGSESSVYLQVDTMSDLLGIAAASTPASALDLVATDTDLDTILIPMARCRRGLNPEAIHTIFFSHTHTP